MKDQVYYPEYLQLDKILNAQSMESDKINRKAHDEMLFIIVHQSYELWFKQILFELDSIVSLLNKEKVAERHIGLAVSRFRRINIIMDKLISQIDIIETMTPLDFLDFRDLLTPASGFQSIQFRLLEAKLGLKRDWRGKGEKSNFSIRLKAEDQQKVFETEKQPGLLQIVDKWLARMPFLRHKNFDFWNKYQESIQSLFDQDLKIIHANQHLSETEKNFELKNLEDTRKSVEALFDTKLFEEQQQKGKIRISQQAYLAALFISLYRGEPLLREPYELLSGIISLDENLTHWRNRHALMAHRMLGTKIGTGGSSGHEYLKKAAEKNRIFVDFYNLSSFLIPRSVRPELPEELKKDLAFAFDLPH